MNSHLWRDYLLNVVKPQLEDYIKKLKIPREQAKVYLLVDNCPGHGKGEDVRKYLPAWIVYMELPPNTTSLIQPMDGGVIQTVKRRYRRQMLLILVQEQFATVADFIKAFTVYDAIKLMLLAWAELGEDEISKVWSRTLPLEGEAETEPAMWRPDNHGLDVEIQTLMGEASRVMPEIDASIPMDEWARVDDFIGPEGGPLAMNLDDIIRQLDIDIAEQEREEAAAAAAAAAAEDDNAEDDEDSEGEGDDGNGQQEVGESRWAEIMDCANKLASFTFDIARGPEELRLAGSFREGLAQLKGMRLHRQQQATISSFFQPRQRQTTITETMTV